MQLGELLSALSAPVVGTLLLIVAIVFAGLLVYEVSRGGAVSIESSWGGFGGGLGGCRVSPAFVYLVIVIVFGSMSSMAILQSQKAAKPPTTEAPPQGGRATTGPAGTQ
jgi:hypothetical protein